MKLKSLAISTLLAFAGSNFAFADQHHSYPGQEKVTQTAAAFGKCHIEIFNNTYDSVSIYAEYDSINKLHFMMYPKERHYISLNYNGSCHPSMYLEAYNSAGMFYSGYTPVNHLLTFNSNLKQFSGMLKKK